VDGFDQGETGCECDDGCEVPASSSRIVGRDAEALELSDRPLDTRTPFVDGLCEEARLALFVGLSRNNGDDAP